MRAAYALRGRAAAWMAAYVAFDPVGAQGDDMRELCDRCFVLCGAIADDPRIDWDWLEAHVPPVPQVSGGLGGIEAYSREIRSAISAARRAGLDDGRTAELRRAVEWIEYEI